MFQRTVRQITWQMGPNFVAISMAEPLKYLLITFNLVALEKVSFSDRRVPKTVC